ncbi:Deacetylases, including yeast histone deacetylase and acetoin utilization protein, partial [uncultured Rubrobacteraceae bacterium]
TPPRRRRRRGLPRGALGGPGSGTGLGGVGPGDLPRRRGPFRGRQARPALRDERGPRRARQDGLGRLPGAWHPRRRDDGRGLREEGRRHGGHPLPDHREGSEHVGGGERRRTRAGAV